MWPIVALCWPTAMLAYAAAVGLLVGVIDPYSSAADSSMIVSPVVAAAVVASAVGVPMTLAANRAQNRRRSAAPTAFVAGVFLLAWVAIHTTLTQHFGYLETLYVCAGLAVATLGYRSFIGERVTLPTAADQ